MNTCKNSDSILDTLNSNAGVPQSCALGPMLFNLNINVPEDSA